ncbi:hypothetical protein GGR57DRAFT_506623 [Xylariaceae sp. FL1272]|nr:hypothetical protein GGR57DRAFT_506623 [Xylariaceae sp. FL1272]
MSTMFVSGLVLAALRTLHSTPISRLVLFSPAIESLYFTTTSRPVLFSPAIECLLTDNVSSDFVLVSLRAANHRQRLPGLVHAGYQAHLIRLSEYSVFSPVDIFVLYAVLLLALEIHATGSFALAHSSLLG